MAEQNFEGGWGGTYAQGHTWEEFDALPRGIKRLYWFAPYDYTAHPAFQAWQRGGDMRAWAALRVEAMEYAVARETLRLYGQAQIGLQL